MPAVHSHPFWWTDEKVAAMHAEYLAGALFSEIGRKWGCRSSSVRNAFKRRRLKLLDRSNVGRFKKSRRLLTDEESIALIDELHDVQVPEALHYTWRRWSWEKRRWWVDMVKPKRPLHKRMPDGPCSANVRPFDYCTPEARAIVDAMNAGKDSRGAVIKMNLCSEGLIFEGKLWFWNWKLRRYSTGLYQVETGRRECLHWFLYERHYGPVPPDMVVRHRDHNQNNLDPANLMLMTRNELARENQATGLQRKAQLHTAALLKRLTTHTPTMPPCTPTC
jgi:hypothetical protein